MQSQRKIAKRIVCISDTHGLHRELEVPFGDFLLHAGDITSFGRSKNGLLEFNNWLGGLPHRHKIITLGNHEYNIEADPGLLRVLSNATVLINDSVTLDGVKIWGSPLTQHYGGAFGRSNAADRVQAYNSIPLDTDIVVTHGPPYGIGDYAIEYSGPSGDKELLEAVKRVRPKLHVYGHAHQGYGVYPTKNIMFINAAMFKLDGTLSKRPIVVELTQLKQHVP